MWAKKFPDANESLCAWEKTVSKAMWKSFHDVKRDFPSADLVTLKSSKDSFLIFDICNNKFRMTVKVNFQFKMVILQEFMTHKEYDKKKF